MPLRICFIAYERMADYAKFIALFRGAEAGCGIAYLAAGGGLIGVVVLHALFWVAEAGFGLWRVRSRLTRYSLRFEWRPATELLTQGAILGLSTAGYTWLATGPIMLLRHSMIDMAQLGQFAIVSSLIMILVGSAYAFFTAALPVLSRSARHANLGMAYGRITVLAIVAAAAAAACIGWLLAPRLVEWALGPAYALAGGLLAPFVLICGVILAPAAYAQMLLLSGERWSLALADLAAGICLAGALPPAVADWGLDGAVLATAGAWLVRAALLIGAAEMHAFRTRRVPLIPSVARAGGKTRGRT